jgi:RNA polymerase sigma-70 factor, ECF subfamily
LPAPFSCPSQLWRIDWSGPKTSSPCADSLSGAAAGSPAGASRGVQAVIYLIFNEGYSATAGESLIRRDLCAESIRLGRVLCELLRNDPESLGLLALMLLQDSRRNARIDMAGSLVTLEEQDRALWDYKEIEEGLRLVEQALLWRRVGTYNFRP